MDTIGVIGLSRSKRFIFTDVATELIENVRCTKVYKPSVLELMDYFEFSDYWWDNSVAAMKETKRFAEEWNKK